MTNQEKYVDAFVKALEVSLDEAPALVYGESKTWDSVGHMALIAALEDAFGIMMEMEDIIALGSFSKGKQILTAKHNVEF